MNLWEGLLELLDEQTEIYKNLLGFMETKQKAIIKNDLEQLEAVVAKERALANHLNLLEKNRLELVAQLVEDLSLEEANPTLSQLGEYLPEKYQAYFQKMKEQLTQYLKTAADLNKVNEELLQSSLAYINFSLNLMLGMQNSAAYGSQGQESGKTVKTSIFDQKI